MRVQGSWRTRRRARPDSAGHQAGQSPAAAPATGVPWSGKRAAPACAAQTCGANRPASQSRASPARQHLPVANSPSLMALTLAVLNKGRSRSAAGSTRAKNLSGGVHLANGEIADEIKISGAEKRSPVHGPEHVLADASFGLGTPASVNMPTRNDLAQGTTTRPPTCHICRGRSSGRA
jgi:hypothetical protein